MKLKRTVPIAGATGYILLRLLGIPISTANFSASRLHIISAKGVSSSSRETAFAKIRTLPGTKLAAEILGRQR